MGELGGRRLLGECLPVLLSDMQNQGPPGLRRFVALFFFSYLAPGALVTALWPVWVVRLDEVSALLAVGLGGYALLFALFVFLAPHLVEKLGREASARQWKCAAFHASPWDRRSSWWRRPSRRNPRRFGRRPRSREPRRSPGRPRGAGVGEGASLRLALWVANLDVAARRRRVRRAHPRSSLTSASARISATTSRWRRAMVRRSSG